jgi:hypothetical protein
LDEREDICSALEYAWECKVLRTVKMIRDQVSWVHDSVLRTIEIDIGIKLIFDDVELVIMARDSSLGIIEFWIGTSQAWTNDSSTYRDIYSFHSDELVGIERNEISIL